MSRVIVKKSDTVRYLPDRVVSERTAEFLRVIDAAWAHGSVRHAAGRGALCPGFRVLWGLESATAIARDCLKQASQSLKVYFR